MMMAGYIGYLLLSRLFDPLLILVSVAVGIYPRSWLRALGALVCAALVMELVQQLGGGFVGAIRPVPAILAALIWGLGARLACQRLRRR